MRANVQMDVDSWTPQVLTVSGDDGESEPAAFGRDLLSGVLYVADRNFLDFAAFIKPVIAVGSDLVLRVRDNAPGDPPDPDVAAVGQGCRGRRGRRRAGGAYRPRRAGRNLPPGDDPRHQPPGQTRGDPAADDADRLRRRGGPRHRRRVPPALAAGQAEAFPIELFFKWFKCFARMDHLLSTSRQGITTQLYVAVIAVLLMHVQTGQRVSLYALAALSRVAAGTQSLAQADGVPGPPPAGAGVGACASSAIAAAKKIGVSQTRHDRAEKKREAAACAQRARAKRRQGAESIQ